ncbi:NAD(P)-binding protein [Auriculariales sp. MPI-PUGE-AT-0066]|nr:NAD(P)-binding protein [Auriculariales sp. MPI-PUGE-AT-0066]
MYLGMPYCIRLREPQRLFPDAFRNRFSMSVSPIQSASALCGRSSLYARACGARCSDLTLSLYAMSSANQPVNESQPQQAFINKLTGGNDFQQKHVTNLHGKTFIVTGGTRGIGFEVSKTLALAGARVVMVSRSQSSADEAFSGIEEAAKQAEVGTKLDLHFESCDFGSLHNVQEVADRIAKQEKRIDVLINDAGVGVTDFGLDKDGIERCFGVNALGHFLFTNRVLPTLRRSAAEHGITPRVVNLTSNLHKLAPGDTKFASLEELNNPNLRSDQYYDRSKLAIILLTKQLAERLRRSPTLVRAVSVHPGAVATEIQDQIKSAFGEWLGAAIITLQKPMMRDSDEGSLGTLWAAVSEDLDKQDIQGAYITDPGKVGGETKQADDASLAQNVWMLCESLVRDNVGDGALLPWDKVAGNGSA